MIRIFCGRKARETLARRASVRYGRDGVVVVGLPVRRIGEGPRHQAGMRLKGRHPSHPAGQVACDRHRRHRHPHNSHSSRPHGPRRQEVERLPRCPSGRCWEAGVSRCC
jgi:hypothetical protein